MAGERIRTAKGALESTESMMREIAMVIRNMELVEYVFGTATVTEVRLVVAESAKVIEDIDFRASMWQKKLQVLLKPCSRCAPSQNYCPFFTHSE